MTESRYLQSVSETARALVADDKGLLAMDESNPTCNQRFAALGIPQTKDARRDWRELIVTTPALADSISGAILYDETIREVTGTGTPFAQALAALGIVPGIKVDCGSKPLAGHPGEQVTEGLDGLPSAAGIAANAHALARYAALCQEAGLVPIVEQLHAQQVALEGLLLKPNMVLPGLTCVHQNSVEEVADATVTCLLRTVPAGVPGIAFLSGGQSAELATARLNATNQRFKRRLPWALTFSFSRAIQQPALDIWRGQKGNVLQAQHALQYRAASNRAARQGEYTPMPHASA